MKVIAFEFTKIHASRVPDPSAQFVINSDVEFISIEKENSQIFKENDIIKILFKHSLKKEPSDTKEAKKLKVDPFIFFEGIIVLSTEKGKGEEIVSNWKDKKLSENLKVSLFNIILRKCTPKALSLEDELNIPLHIKVPKVKLN